VDNMIRAYILINTETDIEEEFIEEAKNIEGVTEVTSVYGIYDFIITVEAKTMEEIKEIITWKVRKIKDVKSTITLMGINGN
tara:strand:+ start:159 stop:404 length:246 start_codon:yes stop_codon:yes gene_type:complete